MKAGSYYLQVYLHQDLQARADRQHERTRTVPPKRGDILDRNGRVLAYSVDVNSVYAVPSEIADAAGTASKLCEALEGCSTRELQTITDRLGRKRPFAWVRRLISPAEARRIADLGLEGVGFVKESQRFYPKKELASQLLGFVGIDNTGLGGLEATYDKEIRGKPGTILIQTDARHLAFSRVERPPTAGSTVELTIDEYLQHIAERELRAGVEFNRAAGGMAIVMDPLHRRDPGARERADLQSPRFRDGAGLAEAQSRRPGYLRARFDLQSGDGVGGTCGRRARCRRSD